MELSDSERAACLKASGYTSFTEHGRKHYETVYLAGKAAGIAEGLEMAAKTIEADGQAVALGMDGRIAEAYRLAIKHAAQNARALKSSL